MAPAQDAQLTFVDGQTNRDVMVREMEIPRMMAANRDAVIHSAAQPDFDETAGQIADFRRFSSKGGGRSSVVLLAR